jgi:hypothetical protein
VGHAKYNREAISSIAQRAMPCNLGDYVEVVQNSYFRPYGVRDKINCNSVSF